MEDIIYFEFNDWTPDKHYPACEPYETWLNIEADMEKQIYFRDEAWLAEQKIIVVESIIDMSLDYCITAPRVWVEKNCPSLLTEYSRFIVEPNEEGKVIGQFGCPFKEYTEENLGYWYAGWDDFGNWNPRRE